MSAVDTLQNWGKEISDMLNWLFILISNSLPDLGIISPCVTFILSCSQMCSFWREGSWEENLTIGSSIGVRELMYPHYLVNIECALFINSIHSVSGNVLFTYLIEWSKDVLQFVHRENFWWNESRRCMKTNQAEKANF